MGLVHFTLRGKISAPKGAAYPNGALGWFALLLAWAVLLQPGRLDAALVSVHHTEGLVHDFLVLRTLEGNTLADGDLIQVARGDRVTSELVFHFKDGSVHDETVVFSQRRSFRLLSDHIVQKGRRSSIPSKSRLTVPRGRSGSITPTTTAGRRLQPNASNCRRTSLTAWLSRY